MTYSIAARDPESGQLGVAVASHVLAVGAVCPWAVPGVGVVLTQAFLEISYGPGLIQAMSAGSDLSAALAGLVAADGMEATRQVGAIAASGEVAGHQGSSCIREAGQILSEDLACQANMMLNPGVPEAMAEAYWTTTGALVVRLLAALDAAEAAGGDIRGRQSAALKVVSGGEPAMNGGYLLDLRVDDHPEPLVELRRLAAIASASRSDTRDGPARLAALTRDNPEGWFWSAVGLAAQGRREEARAALDHAYAVSENWRELLRRLPRPGLLPVDDETLEELLA